MDEPHPDILAEQLKVLEELRVGGVLTDIEFEGIKTKLLAKQPKASGEARPEQAADVTQVATPDEPPTQIGVINELYRILKPLALDGLIVFGFGIAGAALVALAFHFRLRPTVAMAPLAVADVLSFALGFAVVGMRAPVEYYWRRQLYVAVIAWMFAILTVPVLRLSLSAWAFSAIWVGLALALGGVSGRHLRRLSENHAPVVVKIGPRTWAKIPFQAILPAAAAVAAIVILGTSFIAYVSQTKPETVYSNLKLGMTMQQVKEAEGDKPSLVGIFHDANAQDPVPEGAPIHDLLSQRALVLLDATKIPIGKKVEDYPVWSYSSADQHTVLRVDFDQNTKALTGVSCLSTAYDRPNSFGIMNCQGLLGIQDRWSEDALVKKLGKPDEEKTDGDVKILRYTDHGVQYFLMQGGVFMVSLFTPQ